MFKFAMDSSSQKRILKSHRIMPVMYEQPPQEMHTIREYLNQFQGGSVDLCLGSDGIATILLNHPEKRNAISGKMMGDFHDAVEELERWEEGKAVLVCGSGGNFCSGGDLDMARGTGDPDGGYKMTTFMTDVLNRLQVLPFITVALLDGCGAIGGGSEIGVACDYRLISPTCRGVGFVHGRMGIVPAWGGTGRLVNVVGYRNALSILTTAAVLSPQRSLELGLVDEIIPNDVDMHSYVRGWLKPRTLLSPALIHAMKITAQLSVSAQHDDHQEMEKRIFAPFWGGDENRAALASNIKHLPSR